MIDGDRWENEPCRTGEAEHVYWVDGKPQSHCDRCFLHNPEVSRFIAELNERSNFLKIPWEEALRRELDRGIDELNEYRDARDTRRPSE